MKKIRGIRTPSFEQTCRFICIDEFEKFYPTYYCGLQVYLDDEQEVLMKGEPLRFGRRTEEAHWLHLPIIRGKNDIFEPPTIEMYIQLGLKLKEEGFLFNKKTGKFITKNK